MRRDGDGGEHGGEHEIGSAPAKGPASAEVSGAKIVLANPAAKVRVVSACTRRGPYQPVSAANAGG